MGWAGVGWGGVGWGEMGWGRVGWSGVKDRCGRYELLYFFCCVVRICVAK